ncbi:hypothetical protein, conserved [Leishmania tarentolae]|uniref:Uncharacterized protein n=1 Tax=Leishmania tarentolae TaxID=5689 RepID=A0A640KU66_LEITA|nr:hypothetical protein, conserved [Leishmania tarentolae]
MPTHVEGEHVPAFTNPLTASSYLSHDNLPEGRVAQELISARDTQGNERSTRGQRSSADVTASPKDSIEDMVSRTTIPESLPIQNLPVITAPELKLIGRCVDFCVKVPTDDTASVPYYYTGLVSMVTATTVALMYVNRYTREDFVQYKALQRSRANRDSGAAGDGSRAKRTPPPISKAVHALPTEADLEASATPHGESVFGALPVQPNSNEHEMGARENRGPAATADAWGLCAGGAGAVHRGQRVRAFRGLSGSIGPIPYVTFLRKSIHDVEFGRGPHSASTRSSKTRRSTWTTCSACACLCGATLCTRARATTRARCRSMHSCLFGVRGRMWTPTL